MISVNQKYLDKTINLGFQAKQKNLVQRVGIPLTLGLALTSCAGGREVPRTEATDINQPVQMQRTVKVTPTPTPSIQPQITEPVVIDAPQAETQPQPIAEFDSYAFGKTVTNINDCYTVVNPNDCIRGFNDNIRITAPSPQVVTEQQQPIPVETQPVPQVPQRQEPIVQQPSNSGNPLRGLSRWFSSSPSQTPVQQQPIQRQSNSNLSVSGECRSLGDTINVNGFNIGCMSEDQMNLVFTLANNPSDTQKIGSDSAPLKMYMISREDCQPCQQAIREFQSSMSGNNQGQVVVIGEQQKAQIAQVLNVNSTPTYFVHFNNGTPSDLSDDYIGRSTDDIGQTQQKFLNYINAR